MLKRIPSGRTGTGSNGSRKGPGRRRATGAVARRVTAILVGLLAVGGLVTATATAGVNFLPKKIAIETNNKYGKDCFWAPPKGMDYANLPGAIPIQNPNLFRPDKIVIVGSNGRFYTLLGANLPGGRGMGEPLRLMVDLPQEAQILDLFVHQPGVRMIVASTDGDGFIVPGDELLAQTRAGKQVLNLRDGARALICKPVSGDHVACVGENRKMLVFALEELPEMARGKGVRLQKFKDGGLSDLTTLTLAQGLSWKDPAGRTRTETDLSEWLAKRATAGRMAPRGFPRDNKF